MNHAMMPVSINDNKANTPSRAIKANPKAVKAMPPALALKGITSISGTISPIKMQAIAIMDLVAPFTKISNRGADEFINKASRML